MLLSLFKGRVWLDGLTADSRPNIKTKVFQVLCAGLVLTLGSAAAHAGTLSIKNGATLYGKGTVTTGNTTLESGAFLAPGASPGCLATANLSLAAGSQFNAEIEGTMVCTQYDKVSVTGSVNLNSATLNTSLSGYTLQGGDSFTLIDNDAADAVSGIFSGLAEGSIFTLGGKQTSISYVAGDGNDVALQVLSNQLITFTGLANKTHGDSNFVLSASASSGLSVSFASTTPTICSVSGNSVALLNAGNCSITASQSGNASYQAAANVAQGFTISKAAQTISFSALANKTYGAASFSLSAASDSGLAVAFASTTPVVCSVSGSNVSLLGTGNCSISASQTGDANYNPATDVVQSFTVNNADQVITFNALADKTFADAAFAVSASSDAGLSVNYVSTTTAVCTLSGSTVTLVATGSCSITASQAGSANYSAATNVVQAFTVNKAEQVIIFNALSDKTFGDADFALTASSDSALAVSLASTTTAVCTISGATVSIVTAGTCSITASQAGNLNYNAAPDAAQSFIVNQGSQAITFNTLADKNFGDADFVISATSDSGLAVSFTATTASTCTMTGDTINIVAIGSCSITAAQAGDTDYIAAMDVIRSFTISDATPPEITLIGNANVTLTVGDSYVDAGATASDNVDGDITANIVMTGSVDSNTIGSYQLTYNIADLAGNTATTVTRDVNIQDLDTDNDGIGNSIDPDDDNDGIDDINDAYPLISVINYTDTDGDGVPDDCDTNCLATGMIADTDDDNDGMPDIYETSNGLNPLVNDANSDLDADNLSNIFEYTHGSNPGAIEYSRKEADLLLSPLSYRFGVENINDPACETNSQAVKYTIGNSSAESRNLGNISFSGNNAAEFMLLNAQDNCSNNTLASGSSCDFYVAFCPTSDGSKSAMVNIVSNDPDTPNLQATMFNYESPRSEAERRLPPVLSALTIKDSGNNIIADGNLIEGQSYTFNWTLQGYHSNYQSLLVFFDCTTSPAPPGGECGASFGSNFEYSSQNNPIIGSGSWTYNGISVSTYSYSYQFTVPVITQNTEMVIRFYRKSNIDKAAGNSSLSLLVPGNINANYYDNSGRRLSLQLINQ